MQPFYSFQYDFGSSRSSACLLRVASDTITRTSGRFRTTQAGALDIFKALNRVWHAVHAQKLSSYGILGQIFGLISSFLSNRRLRVVLDGKSSQEYPVNAGVPQGSILGPALFLLYINDLPDDAICIIAVYTDDTSLYTKIHQASDLWQQLDLVSELESGLKDTVARSGLFISMLERLSKYCLASLLFSSSQKWNEQMRNTELFL